jgi:hypothetical protein
MKTIILTILALRCFTVLSINEAEHKLQPHLKGKVYSSSFGMDSTTCESIVKETDYSQTLMFINDSVFLQAFYTCCPEPDEEFSPETYYSGIYKLDDTSLTLVYSPERIRIFEKESFNKSANKSVTYERIASENAPINKLTYTRYNCNNIPYFKNPLVESIEFLTPDTVILETFKYQLKSRGIWERLFNDRGELIE